MKKYGSILVCILLFAAAIAGGCQKPIFNYNSQTSIDLEDSAGQQVIQTAGEPEQPGDMTPLLKQQRELKMPDCSLVRYPIEGAGEIELKYWLPMPETLAGAHASAADTVWAQKWQEQTGIRVQWTSPKPGEEEEQFKVMVSSQLLPDIIEWEWSLAFEGGPRSARDSGLVIWLDSFISQSGAAADLWNFLQAHPWIDQQVRSDEGNYYCFPAIASCAQFQCRSGPIVRLDLLEKAGLEPEELSTVDGFYQALLALKAAGTEYPLSVSGIEDLWNLLLPAWNVRAGMYCDAQTGEVKYGYTQRGFRDCMITLAKWTEEGLIDPDTKRNTPEDCARRLLNTESAVTFGAADGELEYFLSEMQKNPQADEDGIAFQALDYPSLEEGVVKYAAGGYYEYRTDLKGSASISADCRNAEAAVRFLNYSYSREGHELMNFGIEGESWQLESGKPAYTELLLEYEAGGWNNLAESAAHYTRLQTAGPFVQDPDALLQYYIHPQQKDALEIWNQNNESHLTCLPPLTLTQEEAAMYDPIQERIAEYTETVFDGWLNGSGNVRGEWEAYLEKLKELRSDVAVLLFQTALNRYYAR